MISRSAGTFEGSCCHLVNRKRVTKLHQSTKSGSKQAITQKESESLAPTDRTKILCPAGMSFIMPVDLYLVVVEKCFLMREPKVVTVSPMASFLSFLTSGVVRGFLNAVANSILTCGAAWISCATLMS